MGKDQELLEAARSGNVTVVEKILGQRAKRSGPLARWVSPFQTLLFHASFPIFALGTAFHATPSVSCARCRLDSTKNCPDVCQFVMGATRVTCPRSFSISVLTIISLLSMIMCLHGIDCRAVSFPFVSHPEHFRVSGDHSRRRWLRFRRKRETRTSHYASCRYLRWITYARLIVTFFQLIPTVRRREILAWTRVCCRVCTVNTAQSVQFDRSRTELSCNIDDPRHAVYHRFSSLLLLFFSSKL